MKLPHVRFTVSAAMAIVIILAIGLAALRNANELWAGFISLLNWALLGVSLIGVILARAGARARWLGYLVLAGGYSLLAFGPWFSEHVGNSLVTTKLMGVANMMVTSSPVPQTLKIQELFDLHKKYVGRLQAVTQVARLPGDPSVKKAQQLLSSVDEQIAAIQGISSPGGGSLGPVGPNKWKTLLPGAANYDQFLLVGHSLSSFLAGVVGSLISVRLHSGRGSPAALEVGTPDV